MLPVALAPREISHHIGGFRAVSRVGLLREAQDHLAEDVALDLAVPA
jgi:hypothetical protein